MLEFIACLVGIFFILAVAEIFWRQKTLRGENLRKFVHILAGSFIAFWPWLIGWRAIQLAGLAMILVVIANRFARTFHFASHINRRTWGDFLFALAVTICALLTTSKIFFAVAILHMSLADGLAAIIGKRYVAKWRYDVFGQIKTVFGSMVFWLVSLFILGSLLIFSDQVSASQFFWLVILLPPALTLLEALAVFGTDDLLVPVAVVLILRLISS